MARFYGSFTGLLLLAIGATVATALPVLAQLRPISPATPLCGTSWNIVDGPNPSAMNNTFYGVAGVTPNDVWAAGNYYNGSYGQTLIGHWDGTSWTVVPSPNVAGRDNTLYSVTARAATDVWAGGYSTNRITAQTLIEHWDGTSWTIIPSPNIAGNDNVIWGITATAADVAWAAGYYGSSGPSRTLLLHWNGSVWSIAPSENVNGNGYLQAVAAVPGGDVWAVGSYITGTFHPLTLRNGLYTASPSPGADSFYGVAVRGANDIWAAGSTDSRTLTEHWDGTAWSLIASPNAGSQDSLDDMTSGPGGEVWAVGYTDFTNNRPLTMRWTGSAWVIVPSPNPTGGAGRLFSAAVVGPGEVWAVGSNALTGGTAQTLIEHYGPPCPSPTPSNTPHPSATALPTDTRGPTDTPAPTQTPGGPTATPAPTHTPGGPTDTPAPSRPPGSPTPTPCAISFSDVHATDYFYTPVLYLACRGVISGYADGTFRPYNNTTRSQQVKIVILGFNVAAYTPPAGAYTFADVPPTFPFFSVIEAAAHAGIVGGYNCGGADEPCDPNNRPYFRPYADVTRGQLAKIGVGAALWTLLNPPSGSFADVAPASAFYSFVETAVCHGIISGYACGGPGEPCNGQNQPYFRQYNPATRGQIAKIVYGALTTGQAACP